jgi:hypothetical protein
MLRTTHNYFYNSKEFEDLQMKIKCIAAALALCLSIFLPSGHLYANDCQPKKNLEEALQPPIPEPMDPDDMIVSSIEDWFKERCIVEGVEKNNKSYYSSVQLALPLTNPHWVKSRQLAFERAMLEIRSQFIQDNYGLNQNEIEFRYFNNDSSNNLEFQQDNSTSKIKAIAAKSMALADEKLNQMLEELDVNPEEYHASSPAKRQAITEDALTKNILIKAMGESSGILSFKTFEANDEDGNHAIGVIALYSPKLRQIAYDMAHGREIAQSSKPGREVSSYYDISPEALTSTFGVRAVKDPQGNHVLLSFAQWGSSYQGTSKKLQKRGKKAALKQAENIATSQMTDFMNSSLTFNDLSNIGDAVGDYLVKQGANLSRKDETTIVDEVLETIKYSSEARIEGTRKVKSWSYKHPYGHQIVGSVKVWSRAGVVASENVKNFTPKAASVNEINAQPNDSSTPKLTISPRIISSPEFGDDSDF